MTSKSHFAESELRCKCKRPTCDAVAMRADFVEALERLRLVWGKPMIIESAARCAFWNAKQGGKPRSQHLVGNAVDVRMAGGKEREAFITLALEHGFTGIGRGATFVHVDRRELARGASPVQWAY